MSRAFKIFTLIATSLLFIDGIGLINLTAWGFSSNFKDTIGDFATRQGGFGDGRRVTALDEGRS